MSTAMRTNNKLNDEDRLVLNALKMKLLYILTILVSGVLVVKILEFFIRP